MATPNIKFIRRDNQLGVVNSGDWNTLAIVGCSVGGSLAVNTPARYTRSSDIIDAGGKGTLVEDAVFLVENFGIAPVVCRAAIVTEGAYGTVEDDGMTGTSVVTSHAATKPYDDYDVVVQFPLGGTIGTGPISYQYSLDGGLTFSAVKSLGTANTLTIAEANAQFDFAAGTIITGNSFSCRTSGPVWDAAALDAALLALQNSMTEWDGALILGAVDGTSAAAVETRAVAMETAEREKLFMTHFRRPNAGESEAAYKTAFDTAFRSVVAPYLSVSAGYEDALSPILFARLARPAALGVAGRFATTRPGRDLAAVADGALPSSIQITDAKGNPKHHDERVYPGLDDSRATTLRTWIGRQGVYICNARILSATGSDIQFVQHRRVANLVCRIVRSTLQLFESESLHVNPETGFVLEEEARDIDVNVNGALATSVVDTNDASDVVFTLNRDDNVLSTFKLKGVCRITPLAYPKFFEIDVGFYNPALKVVPVG